MAIALLIITGLVRLGQGNFTIKVRSVPSMTCYSFVISLGSNLVSSVEKLLKAKVKRRQDCFGGLIQSRDLRQIGGHESYM